MSTGDLMGLFINRNVKVVVSTIDSPNKISRIVDLKLMLIDEAASITPHDLMIVSVYCNPLHGQMILFGDVRTLLCSSRESEEGVE